MQEKVNVWEEKSPAAKPQHNSFFGDSIPGKTKPFRNGDKEYAKET